MRWGRMLTCLWSAGGAGRVERGEQGSGDQGTTLLQETELECETWSHVTEC